MIFYLTISLFIIAVKCNHFGIVVKPGKCPHLVPAPNFVPKKLEGGWIVSKRSTSVQTGDLTCQHFFFQLDNKGQYQVFTTLSNFKTELATTFQAHSVQQIPGQLTLYRSLLFNNLILKGKLTIVATDNASFAVAVQCEELLGLHCIITYVLIKGVVAPPNLDACVEQALWANGLDIKGAFLYTDLEKKCQVNYKY